MGIKIHRTRKTRLVWRLETEKVGVIAGRTPARWSNDPDDPALLIDFVIDAAGGGGTRIAVSVTPDHFGKLLAGMMLVDPTATKRAFETVSIAVDVLQRR